LSSSLASSINSHSLWTSCLKNKDDRSTKTHLNKNNIPIITIAHASFVHFSRPAASKLENKSSENVNSEILMTEKENCLKRKRPARVNYFKRAIQMIDACYQSFSGFLICF